VKSLFAVLKKSNRGTPLDGHASGAGWVAGRWVHGSWIVSLLGLVLIILVGSEAVRRQAAEVYLVRTLGLMAASVALMVIGGLLAFVAWWISASRGADRDGVTAAASKS
jgi:uncharacterized membrane protein